MNKKLFALAMSGLMVFSMTACTSSGTEDPNPSASVSVGTVDDEKVLMKENLTEVSYGEGEEVGNPYFKKGTGADGSACYFVRIDGQEADTEIPMDGTVIYTMDEGTPYIEQISYAFEVDGQKVEDEQYRIYAPASEGSEAEDEEVPEDAESSDTETTEAPGKKTKQ